jgi:ethanolamine utilization cobalamin adenosyltransferase
MLLCKTLLDTQIYLNMQQHGLQHCKQCCRTPDGCNDNGLFKKTAAMQEISINDLVFKKKLQLVNPAVHSAANGSRIFKYHSRTNS